MPKEGDYHDKLRSVDWVRDRVAKREALEYKIRKCYKRVNGFVEKEITK